jgi:hypothetical protein
MRSDALGSGDDRRTIMSAREIDLVSTSISEMSSALRERKISPVELLTATLQRV